MTTEEEGFEPRLGRMRAQGAKRGRKYLHRVLAATVLARGGAGVAGGTARAFSGTRIGRGAGVGRVLVARDLYAAFRRRRVIVKARIVRLAGKGAAGARAHLRYVLRDGAARDGAPGALYEAGSDNADGKAFLARATGDRHQLRLIVSAEDGAQYDDLKPLTRRLMARLEEDLGTRLDWVAVDHADTGHPHTHILLRGKDDRGKDLIIARDYLVQGIRERAAELVDLDLGPRTTREIEARLRAEVDQERLTSIDRALLKEAGQGLVVAAGGRAAFDQAIRAGRLAKLARLGLAEPEGAGGWRLGPGLADTLRRMGERGDIIRTMQRELGRAALERAPADQLIYDPAAPSARPIVGRLVARGLSDEHADRHFLIVDGIDGHVHHVDIGRGDGADPLRTGAILRVSPLRAELREADRTIALVAAASGGRYDVDRHLRHDPNAGQAFAETHVRRLEAMRRQAGAVEREPNGSFVIPPDFLAQAAAFEAARLRDRPVAIETLSPEPLARLTRAQAATWLDRELVSPAPEPLRDAGFGRETRQALALRQRWLVEQALAERSGSQVTCRPGMLASLQRRELLRVAAQLSSELDLRFAEAPPGTRVEGTYRRPVELLSGRHALIERSREFTLVPWRPVLERHVGKTVSGIVREGGISWTIGRGRDGPHIS